MINNVKDGEYTKAIYSLIRNQRYAVAINLLSVILEANGNSRAALSLLAYCYFYTQDFINAANCYEQLTILFPGDEDYKIYYAQSLYQACLYEEAMKVTSQIDRVETKGKVTKLKAAIKYGEEDLMAAKNLVDNCPSEDIDTEINRACILYKEERYEEALHMFTAAQQVIAYCPHLSYNAALCHYRLKEYNQALNQIAAITEYGISEHPEMSVGMNTEGIEVRSVGNTLALHETALIEAFNLKAAIYYQKKNFEEAKDALTDMPPRSEEELDAVTLHNQALINIDSNPSECFEKLQFLLHQNPFPPETFGNLLLLYCKYEYYDLAADVLAENAHLTHKYLTPGKGFSGFQLNIALKMVAEEATETSAFAKELTRLETLETFISIIHRESTKSNFRDLFEFLDALITQQTAPEEAYHKFDDIASKLSESLRKLAKQVDEARQKHDDSLRKYLREYENVLERYIPVLMGQAKIYWDLENYTQVEKIFQKSVEFCEDNDIWKLNVAHVLFMQENKLREATRFYEPIVKKNYDNMLNVSAIVLANLCVSYIMTSQNEEAEELMKKLEKEEEQLAYEDADKKVFHLCIVNLVIGTLYCAKGNYEFGISRVMRSLEPFSKKLGSDTWYHAKRCFLSLIEVISKNMILVRDSVIQECVLFLEQCEVFGRNVRTVNESPLEQLQIHAGKSTVSYEARLLKALILKLQDS